MTIFYSHYGIPNDPPVITSLSPVGPDHSSTTPVLFSIRDMDANVDINTLNATFTFDPFISPVVYNVIVAGVWQSGYGGTITANGWGGYDIVVNTHPPFVEGNWRAYAYIEDIVGYNDAKTWDFGIIGFTMDLLVPSYLGLRIYFSQELHVDAELLNPENYTIDPQDLDSVTCDVFGVTEGPTAPGSIGPLYVDLDVSDLTHGKTYKLTITPNKIQNALQTAFIKFPANTDLYIGVSIFPTFQTVRSTSQFTIEVIFTKPMENSDDIENVSRWSSNRGLEIKLVKRIGPGVYELRTSKQSPSVLYELSLV